MAASLRVDLDSIYKHKAYTGVELHSFVIPFVSFKSTVVANARARAG